MQTKYLSQGKNMKTESERDKEDVSTGHFSWYLQRGNPQFHRSKEQSVVKTKAE